MWKDVNTVLSTKISMFYIVIKIKYIFTSFHTSNYYSLFINLFFKFWIINLKFSSFSISSVVFLTLWEIELWSFISKNFAISGIELWVNSRARNITILLAFATLEVLFLDFISLGFIFNSFATKLIISGSFIFSLFSFI